MSSHAHAGGSTVHAPMAEPSGFIRKYIFSVDHKVIGIQYFLLALTAVFIGMVLSLLMRISPGLAQRHAAVRERRADVARAIPGAGDHARHHHGLLRADHGAAGRLRKLFSADSNWRAGHGFSRLNMLSFWVDVSRLRLHHRRVRGSGRRAHQRLDRLHAPERARRNHRPG